MMQETYPEWPAHMPRNPLLRWWKQLRCRHREKVSGPTVKTAADGSWWVEARCECPRCGRLLPLPSALRFAMDRVFDSELRKRTRYLEQP